MEKEKVSVIPFVKPSRIGNFKLWRSKMGIGKGNGKADIEVINVSNLDSTWSVRIPATFEMFSMISFAYHMYYDGDVQEKSRASEFLQTALSNMMYVSCICNGFYHEGVNMVNTVYANPDLLRDKKKFKLLKKDVMGTIGRFLEWRDDYDKYIESLEPDEQELRQDAVAEQAMEILNGGGSDEDRKTD